MSMLIFSGNRFINHDRYLIAHTGERMSFHESPPKYVPAKSWYPGIRLLPRSLIGARVLGTPVRIVSRFRGGILVEVPSEYQTARRKMIESIRKAHARTN